MRKWRALPVQTIVPPLMRPQIVPALPPFRAELFESSEIEKNMYHLTLTDSRQLCVMLATIHIKYIKKKR